MKYLGKTVWINLLILLGYSLLALLLTYVATANSHDEMVGMNFAIAMMLALGLHLLVILILMIVKFVNGEKELGISYLISVFVVAIVGFSSCLGGTTLFG